MTTSFPPGGLVFCHGEGSISWMIRRLTNSYWNHVAIIDEHKPGQAVTVIQATGHGVTEGAELESLAPKGQWIVVPPLPGLDVAKVLEFAHGQDKDPYGFLTVASILLTLRLPGDSINVMAAGSWICSALAAEAWRAGGWIHDWPDIYQVRPDQLHRAVGGGGLE